MQYLIVYLHKGKKKKRRPFQIICPSRKYQGQFGSAMNMTIHHFLLHCTTDIHGLIYIYIYIYINLIPISIPTLPSDINLQYLLSLSLPLKTKLQKLNKAHEPPLSYFQNFQKKAIHIHKRKNVRKLIIFVISPNK